MMFVNHILFLSLLVVVSGCGDGSGGVAPKQYRYESVMNSGGIARTYVFNLPFRYYEKDSASYPLVIALHGTGGSAVQMERTYGLNEKANDSDFIVAYPEGVQSNGPFGVRTWNTGNCCDYAMQNNIDDGQFIRALIDKLQNTRRVDLKRIYITGMSNGGMMAYTLGCELADKIAAIAPVSASMMRDKPCNLARPVPVLHIHSLLDSKVPYHGGTGIGNYYFPPVDSVLTVWAMQNGCENVPYVQDNGKFVKTTWDTCSGRSAIECYVTYDGGHSWPGGLQAGIWGDPPSTYINANDLMWEFFQRFELP